MDVVAQAAAVQRTNNARAKALALHLALALQRVLFVRVFEVGVPVETVFVEAQEAS